MTGKPERRPQGSPPIRIIHPRLYYDDDKKAGRRPQGSLPIRIIHPRLYYDDDVVPQGVLSLYSTLHQLCSCG